MKPQKIPFYLAILFAAQSVAQISNMPYGSQNTFLGHVSSCHAANFSSLNNPALLGLNPKTQLAIAHETPYIQKELATSAISVQTELKKIPVGMALVQSGNEHFKQHLLSLGLAQKLNKNLSIGIALNYLNSQQYLQENLHNIYGSVGFTLKVNKQLLLSTHLINPWASQYKLDRKQAIGQFFQAGVAYQFSDKICFLAESHSQLKALWVLRFGFLYQIKPQISFSTGFSQNLESFSGGILVKKGPINWVIGAHLNRVLGLSPSTEINYHLP